MWSRSLGPCSWPLPRSCSGSSCRGSRTSCRPPALSSDSPEPAPWTQAASPRTSSPEPIGSPGTTERRAEAPGGDRSSGQRPAARPHSGAALEPAAEGRRRRQRRAGRRVRERRVRREARNGGCDGLMAEEGDLPLRVTSAALRSVVSGRHADHYGRVVDFVEMVWQQASSLLTYQHYLKLTLAFKAKLLMEMFVRQHGLLDILQTLDKYFPPQSAAHPRASRREVVKEQQCRLQFRRLVLQMVRDGAYRHHFLQADVEQEFGAVFMAAAEELLWEFLQRIENVLPPPRIEQPRASAMDTGSLSPDQQPRADRSRTLHDHLLHPEQQRGRRHGSGTNGTEPEPERGVAPLGSRCLTMGSAAPPDQLPLADRSWTLPDRLPHPPAPSSPGMSVRAPGGGGGDAGSGCPQSPVSALHSDQWRCPTLPRPPPDPLQYQRTDPRPAGAGAAALCDPCSHSGARRAGPSKGPGAEERGSGGGGADRGLDPQRVSSAPLPREVGEHLARCPQFQPTVVLERLSGGQRPRGVTAVAGSDRQRGPTAAPPWDLRLKGGGGRSWTVLESEEGSPQWGETPPSDPSDHDYYPFCSQDAAQGRWARRNSVGQFAAGSSPVGGNSD
ncbi:uncharacterized protein LOC144594437 [Rhinoraja longicauda]